MNAFFDTNILVNVQEAGGKAGRAHTLLLGGGKLSVQVLDPRRQLIDKIEGR